jgi:hypothetical protein
VTDTGNNACVFQALVLMKGFTLLATRQCQPLLPDAGFNIDRYPKVFNDRTVIQRDQNGAPLAPQ